MRRRLSALASVLVIVAGVAAAPASSREVPPTGHLIAVVAKSCSAGYTHAVIGGHQKCLRRGEFCARRYRRQYRRYGYRCVAGRLR